MKCALHQNKKWIINTLTVLLYFALHTQTKNRLGFNLNELQNYHFLKTTSVPENYYVDSHLKFLLISQNTFCSTTCVWVCVFVANGFLYLRTSCPTGCTGSWQCEIELRIRILNAISNVLRYALICAVFISILSQKRQFLYTKLIVYLFVGSRWLFQEERLN